MVILSQNTKGFPLPKRLVESVLIKDGFIPSKEPIIYRSNTFVALLEDENGETVVIPEKPIDIATIMDSRKYRISWFISPVDTRDLIDNQLF